MFIPDFSNILKIEEIYNKNRSTASLYSLEFQERLQFNLKYTHKTR